MKLCRLTLLRLKSYFKKPTLILALVSFLVILWAILNYTNINVTTPLVLPIGVIDLDQTEYSNLIIQRVGNKDTITIETTIEDEALNQVSTGKLEAIYILKEGLMEQVIDGDIENIIEIVKSPVSLSAEIIGELFSAELMRLSSNGDAARSVVGKYGDLVEDRDKLWTEAWEMTDGYWEPSPVITTSYHSTNKFLPATGDKQEVIKIKNNILEILLLTLLMFSILIASGSLLTEKDNGILKRILSTGTPLWIYLLSNVLTIVIIHTMGLFLTMLFTNQIDLLMANIGLYMMYMVWAGALGLVIIAFTKKMQQLLIIVPFITLSNSLLIWKLQGYNGFSSNILILGLLSMIMLMVAIKAFSYKIS